MNNLNKFLKNSMRSTMNRSIIFSLLLILLSAWPGWCATYYVKSGGNDRLNGHSDATAWATISKVSAKAVSGDTVFFRSQDTWSTSLPLLSATAGVIYDGSSYGSGTRAKLRTTAGQKYPYFAVVQIYASNVTFRGFEIDGNNQDCGGIYVGYNASADMSGVTVDNCIVHDIGAQDNWLYGIHIGSANGHTIRNVSITNTTVYHTNHEGIAVYSGWSAASNKSDTVLIRNCTIHDTGRSSVGSGCGIEICNDADNVTVEYCNLYNNHYGIYIRVSPTSEGSVVSAPKNMIIRYNLIHDNMIYGICTVNGRNLTMSGDIYSNLFYGQGKVCVNNFAIDLSLGGDTAFPPSTFSVYNNTFYSTTNQCSVKYVVAMGLWSVASSSPIVNLKNNIVYAGNYIPIYDTYGHMNHSNNLIFRSSGASDTHILSSGISYDRSGVLKWEPSARNTRPVFIGGDLPTGFIGAYGIDLVPDTNYFAIRSGDAIDNGATLGIPYNGCINGAGLATPITRPQEAGYDIGAYEHIKIQQPHLIKQQIKE